MIIIVKGDILMLICPYISDYKNYFRAPDPESYIRILHASPNAPAVDVYVNNVPTFRNISYRGFSQYAQLPGGGLYNIKVFPAGTKVNPVINTNIFIADGKIYTVPVIGELPNISLLPVEDPRIPITPGKASIRFVHLSPDAPNVDITLPNGTKLFSNVGYKEIEKYINVNPGTYTLQARVSGTDKVVLNVPNVRLTPNRFYTVYAVGFASKSPGLQALIPLDGNSYLEFLV